MKNSQKNISFFKRPIKNTEPKKSVSLMDIYETIISDDYRYQQVDLRKIEDKDEGRNFKAKNFDYVTFSGTFAPTRANKNLVEHSGFLCLDFDNLENPENLIEELLAEDYISTALLFRSPSGNGVKWVISPIDITAENHTQHYETVSTYVLAKYGVETDNTAKDVSRSCYLAHDPQAYIRQDNKLRDVWSIEGLEEWLQENNPEALNSLNPATVPTVPHNLNAADFQHIETVTQRIETAQLDITTPYNNWRDLGFALANQLEEDGRPYFHRISRFNKEYDENEADNQYDSCLTSQGEGITIATFFHIAKNAGIDISKQVTPFVTLESLSVNDYQPPTISAAQLINRKIENIPCLLEPILQKVGLACIAGSSDTGKSSLLRNLCLAIVAGETQFLDFKINALHKRAIYVSTEDDETAIAYLLQKQNKDIKKQPEQHQELHFIFDTADIIPKLDKTLEKIPADIVVIDAFTDLYNGRMNESNQVRTYLNAYSQLAQKHQCLVFFLHHCGKRTEELQPSKHNLLGSQALEAKMRLVIELRSDLTDDSLKHLCIVKGNYLNAEIKKQSYVLTFTENMTFRNTGERTLIDKLAKKTEDVFQKYMQAVQYKEQGLTHAIIAEKIGYKSGGTVSKLLKRYEGCNQPLPWEDDFEVDMDMIPISHP